jgi:hypothetical protein
MTKEIYLSGTAKWVKYLELDRYDNYTIDLYLDKKSKKKFEESGVQLKVRSDEGGEYVTFKRRGFRNTPDGQESMGRPVLYDENNDVVEDERLIGNGSKVTIKIRVYTTSMGIGHEWVSFRIDELVEYNPVQIDEDIDVPF